MLSKEEKEEREADIRVLKEEKEELETQDTNDSYDEILNETKKSWIEDYDGATVFKEIDPVAYRCGLVDYNDPRLCEIDGEIDDLESELVE